MEKLKGDERRNRILERIQATDEPLSGSQLAKEFGVSRQVIVNDVALLRGKHPDILATARGYIMLHADPHHTVFKVMHTEEQLEDELCTIVNLGGTIVDVYVEHRVYGTIRLPLDISSQRDVGNFLHDMESGVSSPLMNVTHGYHYHTVEARSEQVLTEIEEALKAKGYWIETRQAPTIYEPKIYGNL